LGAVLCQRDEKEVRAMAAYGRYLGNAFQLIDDVMDYRSSSEQMGKNVGDDLAEGKPTLPLIYAMAQGSEAQAELVKTAIEKGGHGMIDEVQAILQQTQALEYTEKMAQQQAELAIAELAILPDSDNRRMLENIARLSVYRSH
jgi:octaprenyl-diphosphate synthase